MTVVLVSVLWMPPILTLVLELKVAMNGIMKMRLRRTVGVLSRGGLSWPASVWFGCVPGLWRLLRHGPRRQSLMLAIPTLDLELYLEMMVKMLAIPTLGLELYMEMMVKLTPVQKIGLATKSSRKPSVHCLGRWSRRTAANGTDHIVGQRCAVWPRDAEKVSHRGRGLCLLQWIQ